MDGYNYGLQDLPMIKFRWLAIQLLKRIVSSAHRNVEIVQGQLRINSAVSDKTSLLQSLPELKISEYETARYVKEIAQLCHNNDVTLVLIELPCFKKTRNKTSVGPHKIFIDSGLNVYLYNFNKYQFATILDSKTDWLGNSHLNQYGAVKLTNRIKEVVFK